MSEADAVDESSGPVTVASLLRELRALGVEPGGVLLVHASLSSLGWVCGGEHAVVLALEEAVGPDGTLVMPAFSAHLSDPAEWSKPPVPKAWWPVIREHLPPFDPWRTPTRGMGAVADCFRAHPDVRRSRHPQHSFAARGPHAERITADHALDDGLGERSPLTRLYELDARVLLLGVGHDRNSSLHLAEYRADWLGTTADKSGVPTSEGWVTLTEQHTDGEDFEEIGAAFADEAIGRVGAAEARLFRQRAAVDFAAAWISGNRR